MYFGSDRIGWWFGIGGIVGALSRLDGVEVGDSGVSLQILFLQADAVQLDPDPL